MRLLTAVPLVSALLASCSISSPFRIPDSTRSAPPAPDDPVIVVVTQAKVGSNIARNLQFWRQVSRVYRSLETQPGLLGYSIRRQLLGDQAWTITAWSDAAALQAFVAGGVHRQAMNEGSPALTAMSFVRAEVRYRELPLSWAAAEHILAQSGSGYGSNKPATPAPAVSPSSAASSGRSTAH